MKIRSSQVNELTSTKRWSTGQMGWLHPFGSQVSPPSRSRPVCAPISSNRNSQLPGCPRKSSHMHQRALAAEYHLLETIHVQPDFFPATLKQIEERIYGELIEANLKARQQPAPYGPGMLIDVQDRLRNLAKNAPASVGHQEFECLLGVAGLMTGECRIWWGPRFPIAPGAA